MSAARRKGNALELEVARRLQAIDGRDPRFAPIESAGGRLGPAYVLQCDIATRSLACEAKNREDNPARLWDWLDKLAAAMPGKLPLLALKRNRRRPLVVLALDDFERLLRDACRRPGVDL